MNNHKQEKFYAFLYYFYHFMPKKDFKILLPSAILYLLIAMIPH